MLLPEIYGFLPVAVELRYGTVTFYKGGWAMKYQIIGSTMPAVEILFEQSGESMYTQSGLDE